MDDKKKPENQTPDELSRRRFLALMAASAAFGGAAGCTSPSDRGAAVPYTKKPAGTVIGVPDFYASTFYEGTAAQAVLVHTREGRPIHIEGNDLHPYSGSKTSLRAIADVLSLYDPDRLFQPMIGGEAKTWERAGREVFSALQNAKSKGRPVLLVTGAVSSPTQQKLISQWLAAVPTLKHVAWEPVSNQSAARAMQKVYGVKLQPIYRLDKAKVILSLGADFLGVSGSPESIRQFADGRRVSEPGDNMSRFYVVEGPLSLTGMNADYRIKLRPSQCAEFAFCLAKALHERHGLSLPAVISDRDLVRLDDVVKRSGLDARAVDQLLRDLASVQGEGLVLVGAELPEEAHVAGHLLNEMLHVRGVLLDYADAPDAPELASNSDMAALIDQIESGAFDLAFFWETNPCYALPQAERFSLALKKIPLTVSLSLLNHETSAAANIYLPANHWLESWGDFYSARDLLSLRQAVISPLFDTRQPEDLVLGWLSELGEKVPAEYREYLRARWQRDVYPAGALQDFNTFWQAAVHDGFFRFDTLPRRDLAFNAAAVQKALPAPGKAAEGLELVLHAGQGVYDGRYANNGWLQELPDAVTKVVWNNPLLIAHADAERLGVGDGELVEISAGGASLEAAVVVQPGQAAGVVSMALGYGRQSGSVASKVGVNAYPLLGKSEALTVSSIALKKTGRAAALSRSQTHDLLGALRKKDLELVQVESLERYKKNGTVHTEDLHSLYPEHAYPDLKWGMAIDLNACVGCGGCVVACQSENNSPVVGAEQVGKGRDMHWIRIDRYYTGDLESPDVRIQPLACQQCDNAPCENVCPVAATNHSPDGINQMAYNRCIGTRYCANNCPYKVRRFNYFDYTLDTPKPREMVFNPEVTVRPRGVMEKCTFCIQRIQFVKWRAKKEGRPIRDGEIKTACQAACPAKAIVFGNLKDPNSEVSKLSRSNRGYKMLSELGVKPAVTYLKKLRNRGGPGGAA